MMRAALLSQILKGCAKILLLRERGNPTIIKSKRHAHTHTHPCVIVCKVLGFRALGR